MDAICGVCGEGFTNQGFSILCDHCKTWFHGKCVHMEEYQAEELDTYHCSGCESTHGKSIPKSVTNNHRHNKTETDAHNKPMQSGTTRFVDHIKTLQFIDAKSDGSALKKMRGQQLSFINLLKTGFDVPVLVESNDGLELTVPQENAFSVPSILEYISGDYVLDIIDVKRQLNTRMKTREFVNCFNMDAKQRTDIYNCISLEVSHTPLTKLVKPPAIVNKLSWVENYWPEVEMKPAVSKYCLLSMQDSFTDFHVDFGGTSVWYHVLTGEKVFYLVKPTEANLDAYEQWAASNNSSEHFFGKTVDQCYRLNLIAGQTLFIPTAWIHAVHTPLDSIVFGGNFLHSLNIEMQLKINEMEQRIKTPDKFRFPYFELTHWYAAPNVLKLLQDNVKQRFPPRHLADGVKALMPALKGWLQRSRVIQNDYMQTCMLAPKGFNCGKLLKDLAQTHKQAERKIEGQPIVKKRGKSYKSFDLDNSASTDATNKSPKKGEHKKSKNNENIEEHSLSEDKSLVMDELNTETGIKVRKLSDSESKSGLKLTLNVSSIGGLSEVKDILHNSNNNTSNELNNSIIQQSPQLINTIKPNSNTSNETSVDKSAKKRKSKKLKTEQSLDEDIESIVKGRPHDDQFIYNMDLDLDLEIPGEEQFKSKQKSSEKDEAWAPKTRVKATPKEARIARENARRDALETSIANVAKVENSKKLKRNYPKKKLKPTKTTPKNVTEQVISNMEDNASNISASVVNNAQNVQTISHISHNQTSISQTSTTSQHSCSQLSYLTPSTSTSTPSSTMVCSSTKTTTNTHTTQVHKSKPKKGLATPKQRIAKKLKMTGLQNFSL